MGKSLVLEFWGRSDVLNLNNPDYYSYITKLIGERLMEDAFDKDITADSLVLKDENAKAAVVAEQSGIIAGVEESSLFRKYFGIKAKKNDGNPVRKGDIILEIYGNGKKMLGCERTLLNIMQRMSGIATAAYGIKKAIGNKCLIAGTRKTLFGLMDKKALSVGGALTHRLNLEDLILIKGNHLKLLGSNIGKALELADKNNRAKYAEIEVKNGKEAMEAANMIIKLKSCKKFAIMFDNMDAPAIKNSITKISNRLDNYNKKIKNNSINKNCGYKNKKIILFEASGGINEKNIREYSKTGVDVISLGFLTHSAKAFDMSLEIL